MQPSDSASPPPVRRPGMIPIGRIFGVPVFLTASWVLVSIFLVIGYGPILGGGRGGFLPYVLGLSIAVCLALTVLLHEIGHAAVARRFRVGVRSITLELLGGVTEMDNEAPTPRAEAAIALAGPAVSIVLTAVSAAFLLVTDRGTLPGELVLQMTVTNGLVAAFNILPGLPLDGGRALRAGLWGLTKDEYRADIVSGWAGRVIALATFALALAYIRVVPTGGLIGMVLLVAVAMTLWNGATASIRAAVVRLRLPRLVAGAIARPIHLVVTGTPLSEALRQRDEFVLAVADINMPASIGVANSTGQVIGLVSARAVAAVPPARRPWVDVDSVSAPIVATQRIDASSTGMDVLDAVGRNPDRDLLVTVGEDVVGVLRVADVVTMLHAKEPRS